jgi:hypothetical protein
MTGRTVHLSHPMPCPIKTAWLLMAWWPKLENMGGGIHGTEWRWWPVTMQGGALERLWHTGDRFEWRNRVGFSTVVGIGRCGSSVRGWRRVYWYGW